MIETAQSPLLPQVPAPAGFAKPTSARGPRPRVVWDMTFANRSLTGTGVYVRNLFEATAALGAFDLTQISAASETERASRGNLRTNVRNLRWLIFDAENHVRQQQPALLHAAAYLGPRRVHCPVIVNVFDTTYVKYPHYFDWKWRLYARTFIRLTINNAAAIMTLSEFARGEICRSYAVPRERVHIAPPGIGVEFHPIAAPSALAAMRARYRLSENYLLHVGEPHPRKNLPALIAAFATARREIADLQFVLVGPRRASSLLDRAIAQFGVSNAVRQLDFVPQVDLPLVYAGARAFVYASRMEGFGIPPVEAMASGVPVVSAPNPPMPEVLGDAAYFTVDDSPAALASGILKVLNDETLACTLRAHGVRRARLFTWENSARTTGSVYESVLATQPRRVE